MRGVNVDMTNPKNTGLRAGDDRTRREVAFVSAIGNEDFLWVLVAAARDDNQIPP